MKQLKLNTATNHLHDYFVQIKAEEPYCGFYKFSDPANHYSSGKKIKKLSNTVAFCSLWRGVNYIYGLGHLRSLPVKLMYCHSNSRPRMWGPFWECTFLPFFIGEKDISVYLKSTHSQTDTVTQFSEKSIMALQLRHVSKREKRLIYFSSL